MIENKPTNNYALFNKHLSKVSETTINKFGSLDNVIIFLLELCECGHIGLVTKNFKRDSPSINHLSIHRIINNDISLKKCVKLAQSYAAEITKADAENILRDRAINGYEEVTLDSQGECVQRKKKYCSKSLLEYLKANSAKYQNVGKSNYGNETNKNEIKTPNETAVFEIEAYESDNTKEASN